MEVEESTDKQCNITEMDTTGIESMEVDELDRKDSIPRSRVSSFNEEKRNNKRAGVKKKQKEYIFFF